MVKSVIERDYVLIGQWVTLTTGSASVVCMYIQLFQLTLSDRLRLTRQDRRVVWVVANQN